MFDQALLNLRIYGQLRKRLRAFRLSEAEIAEMQLLLLKDLLIYSYRTFEFYRRRFDSAGFQPERMRRLEDLRGVPCLSKEEYRSFTESGVSMFLERNEAVYQDGTSGSTGMPLKIYRTGSERAYMLSKYLRALFLNGYRKRGVTFCLPSPHRISPSDSFVQRFGFMRRVSVPYTAPVEEMVQAYRKQKVDLLYANRSHLVLMAEHIREKGIPIEPPRRICSSGETMDTFSRKTIEEVFGNDRLFEVYGAVEFNNLAFQRVGDSGFHFNHDTNILELEDESGRWDNRSGRCIVTDLHIRSFPLIRYRLGDWLEMESGGPLPKIRHITGRSDDWFMMPEGEKMPFHPVYEIMERESGVSRFRFVQEALDQITAQLVLRRGKDHKGLEERLLTQFSSLFQGAMRFRFEYFDTLPADPNGKARMVISRVRRGAGA